jgi:hypothetical protein
MSSVSSFSALGRTSPAAAIEKAIPLSYERSDSSSTSIRSSAMKMA